MAESEHFAVIGSGAWLANSSLCQREYDSLLSEDEAVYQIYEAKRLSEKEPTVGPRTNLMVLDPDMGTRGLAVDGMEFLDTLGDQLGPQKIPPLTFPNHMFFQLPSDSDAEEDDSGSAESGGGKKTPD